jgi:hypothetical protein
MTRWRSASRLDERSQATLLEVFRLLKTVDAGGLVPVPLHDYAKTGDLTGCGKLVVAIEGEPEHQIVVRDLGERGFEVSEVIAVEDRAGDLPYLFAGLALCQFRVRAHRNHARPGAMVR